MGWAIPMDRNACVQPCKQQADKLCKYGRADRG